MASDMEQKIIPFLPVCREKSLRLKLVHHDIYTTPQQFLPPSMKFPAY